ncbi:MAG: exosortase/archaeosortase family protein [Candidatus Omnitrophica bacterium]|nr:exosortase/archaeosortase family protein [Candidatus Omnitrophota bacterium]
MEYIKLAITFLFFALLYLPVVGPLIKEWISVEDYSHGFLIPLISLYFLWHKREDLRKTAVSPSFTGLVFMLSGVTLYLLARAGYQFFLQCFSALIVLFGIIYASAGKEMARKMAFSIGYLIFMIPLPQLVYNNLTFHLRLLSTKLAYLVLMLLGSNATREGNIINLSTCSLVIANPCSGLRGLIVMIAASLAVGYLFQNDIRKRAILFASSFIIAIIVNTARLVVTAITVDIIEAFSVPAVVHDVTGFIAMGIGLVALFWLNDILRKTR